MPKPLHERAALVAEIAEIFREHGYEGARLSIIEARVQAGKGTLYHFFPRGKEEMAEAVLESI